jgi:hypothetical protein
MLSLAIRQITEVTNFDEAAWKHMKQETAHKLDRIECHDLLLVAVCRITPAKGNLAVLEAKAPSIGDGHSVSVVSQILNHVLRSGKRLLGIDDPLLLFQKPGEAIEGLSLLERRECAAKPKLAFPESPSEQGEELATKQSAEHLYRKKEVRTPARNPACLIKCHAAGRHEAMDMRMMPSSRTIP